MQMIRNAILLMATLLPGVGVLGIVAHATRLFATEGPLERWQTMVTGLIALMAAFIGAYYVNKQTQLGEQHEQERNRRRFDAARAVLPFTLSALTSYAGQSGKLLRAIHRGPRNGNMIVGPLANLPELPALPQSSIAELRELIASAEVPLGELVAEILAEMQVQHVRLSELYTEMTNPSGNPTEHVANVETFIIDAAVVYARSSALFDFARRETTELPSTLTAANVISALNLMRFYDALYEDVHSAVRRRMRVGPSEVVA
jgi:hypothetical protein